MVYVTVPPCSTPSPTTTPPPPTQTAAPPTLPPTPPPPPPTTTPPPDCSEADACDKVWWGYPVGVVGGIILGLLIMHFLHPHVFWPYPPAAIAAARTNFSAGILAPLTAANAVAAFNAAYAAALAAPTPPVAALNAAATAAFAYVTAYTSTNNVAIAAGENALSAAARARRVAGAEAARAAYQHPTEPSLTKLPDSLRLDVRIDKYAKLIKDVSTWIAGFTAFGLVSSASINLNVAFFLFVAFALLVLAVVLAYCSSILVECWTVQGANSTAAVPRPLDQAWSRLKRRHRIVVFVLITLAALSCVTGLVLLLQSFATFFRERNCHGDVACRIAGAFAFLIGATFGASVTMSSHELKY